MRVSARYVSETFTAVVLTKMDTLVYIYIQYIDTKGNTGRGIKRYPLNKTVQFKNYMFYL